MQIIVQSAVERLCKARSFKYHDAANIPPVIAEGYNWPSLCLLPKGLNFNYRKLSMLGTITQIIDLERVRQAEEDRSECDGVILQQVTATQP
jgi:hypothetical protein